MPSDAVSIFAPRSLLDGMLALALVAAVLWLCAVAAVWGRQERLIFRPDARPLGSRPESPGNEPAHASADHYTFDLIHIR